MHYYIVLFSLSYPCLNNFLSSLLLSSVLSFLCTSFPLYFLSSLLPFLFTSFPLYLLSSLFPFLFTSFYLCYLLPPSSLSHISLPWSSFSFDLFLASFPNFFYSSLFSSTIFPFYFASLSPFSYHLTFYLYCNPAPLPFVSLTFNRNFLILCLETGLHGKRSGCSALKGAWSHCLEILVRVFLPGKGLVTLPGKAWFPCPA